ncbi:cyclic GMP-AMP synthase [Seriola dumerili]|uniref:cyclic GMP-AMP synthase n=1 Tax=Seriola dumerili TaxID=41447 RepID=UPI000BBE28F9|nr:cyclic GMP-AMP synthase [Seriola dumerili]
MPTDNTKAPVQDTKAKTCASSATKTKPETPKGTTTDSLKPTKARKRSCKTKSTEQSAEETTNMTPAAPKETTKDSPKTTKARKRSCKTKSTEQSAEETTNMTPAASKETTKDSPKTTKARKRSGKTKSTEQSAEETTKMTPEAPKETTKDSLKTTKAKTGAGNDIAAVDSILFTTLNKLKIKKNDRANAAEVINEIIGKIIEHVKKNIDWFKEVEQLNTGSYYENLKISNPDEFDVMLAIPVDRVTIARFGNDGAYYSVGLKRGNSPLRRFQDTNTLSATKMLDEFREEVKKCVKAFPGWEVTRKKKGCPAVTMTTEVQSVTISLDVVLCLKVKSSWPDFTKDGFKIESWLGTKIRQAHRRKPYYLVPKYEGNGNVENDDGVLAKDVWRISFSHVEKDILKNHGSVKTCCEKEGEHCCRKDCLKLLKHLLSLLKEKNTSFDKFCSYHAKTTFFHACCTRTKDSDWMASDLSQCFQQLLKDFVGHLEEGFLPNFFIPGQNLLSGPGRKKCDSLAHCIKQECKSGFPIFK